MKLFKVVIISAVVIAIASGIVAQWRTRGRLIHELDEVRQLERTKASQRTQVDQASAQRSEGPRPPPQTTAVARQPEGKTAQQPNVAVPPVEANLSGVGLIPAEGWKNAGRRTPSEAFETFEWALDRGEIDTLAASFAFAPEVKLKLDELFANLSDEVRAKYKTPESVIALLVSGTSKGPQAFQVLGETFEGTDTATVRVRMQQPDGSVKDSDMHLRQEADGWKALVSGQQALGKITEFFPEAAWKTLESKKR